MKKYKLRLQPYNHTIERCMNTEKKGCNHTKKIVVTTAYNRLQPDMGVQPVTTT